MPTDILLTWDNQDPIADSTRIERQDANAPGWSEIDLIAYQGVGIDKTYQDPAVADGTYDYRVSTVSGGVDSDPSNIGQLTVPVPAWMSWDGSNDIAPVASPIYTNTIACMDMCVFDATRSIVIFRRFGADLEARFVTVDELGVVTFSGRSVLFAGSQTSGSTERWSCCQLEDGIVAVTNATNTGVNTRVSTVGDSGGVPVLLDTVTNGFIGKGIANVRISSRQIGKSIVRCQDGVFAVMVLTNQSGFTSNTGLYSFTYDQVTGIFSNVGPTLIFAGQSTVNDPRQQVWSIAYDNGFLGIATSSRENSSAGSETIISKVTIDGAGAMALVDSLVLNSNATGNVNFVSVDMITLSTGLMALTYSCDSNTIAADECKLFAIDVASWSVLDTYDLEPGLGSVAVYSLPVPVAENTLVLLRTSQLTTPKMHRSVYQFNGATWDAGSENVPYPNDPGFSTRGVMYGQIGNDWLVHHWANGTTEMFAQVMKI
jgi:hypothetical protein